MPSCSAACAKEAGAVTAEESICDNETVVHGVRMAGAAPPAIGIAVSAEPARRAAAASAAAAAVLSNSGEEEEEDEEEAARSGESIRGI